MLGKGQYCCFQCLCLMFEHGAHLSLIDTGKPFDELLDSGSAGKVFIQRGYWNPRAGKHPGTADFSRSPLNGRTCVPVCHLDHSPVAILPRNPNFASSA